MTFDPYNDSARRDRDLYTEARRDVNPAWGLGALGALLILGLALWAFSGPSDNVASIGADTNTGTVTRPATRPTPAQRMAPEANTGAVTAPAPAPAATPEPAAPTPPAAAQ